MKELKTKAISIKLFNKKDFRELNDESKEDYLALYQCLKDTGVNSIGDIEVKASRL